MDPKESEITKRYASLDGLRGLAAVLVVLLHVDWTNHVTENNFVKNGYLAVDLFFVLSGFVIAANYSTRIRSMRNLGQFLVLRTFRLYPLHVAVLSIFVIVEFGKLIAVNWFGVLVGSQAPFSEHNSVMALIANLFLIQGLHLFPSPTWNGPSWSISCEFAAYVIFGVAFFFRLSSGKLYVWGGLVVATACYLWIVTTKNTLDVTTDWGVLRCFAGFYLGTIAFLLAGRCRDHFDFSGLMQLSVAGAVLVTLTFATGYYVLLAIPSFFLLVLTTQLDVGPVARVLTSRPIQFLGRISYSIYMIHQLIIVLFLIGLKRSLTASSISVFQGRTIVILNPWLGDFLIASLLGLTIVAAVISYFNLEDPARKLGRRIVGFGIRQPAA